MGVTADYGVPEREKRARTVNIKHLVSLAAAEAGLDVTRPIQEQFKNGNGEAAIKSESLTRLPLNPDSVDRGRHFEGFGVG